MEWEMIDINCAKKDVNSPMAAETVELCSSFLTLAASVDSNAHAHKLSRIDKLYQETLLHRSLKSLQWP